MESKAFKILLQNSEDHSDILNTYLYLSLIKSEGAGLCLQPHLQMESTTSVTQ